MAVIDGSYRRTVEASGESHGSPIADKALSDAIERAQSYLLSIQHPDGYWWGELESNVTITAEYLLLTHFLGIPNPERWRKIANYLRHHQRADGTWGIYYGAPGDLSTTIEAYFALKMTGVSPDEPYMERARAFILAQGGIPQARIFTKLWLALFGQYDWAGLPAMPPELIYLPSWFPFNIYDFACWARGTITPLYIVLTEKPVRPIPDYARLDELYCRPEDRHNYTLPNVANAPLLSWKRAFGLLDKALHQLERFYTPQPFRPLRERRQTSLRQRAIARIARWVITHQEEDGSWGGIQPPWVYSLIGLATIGYKPDDPVIAKGMQGFEGFAHETEEMFWTESCLSPVWDTALATIALRDSGLPADHPALVRAGRWLLGEQIFSGGDWQVKNHTGRPGGWAFEFANDLYPDTDDTAEVLLALRRIAFPPADRRRYEIAMQRGIEWTVSMQSSNGGWAAFDRNNTRRVITQIPFCDFGEVLDPPSEDVTAHVLEMLGVMGYSPADPIVARGLAYLHRTQEPDGSWWGRWGVNYIYGLGAVLPALRALGMDMHSDNIRRAVNWLLEHQQPNGGWGEDCATYDKPDLRGKGATTASQTAWALLALLAATEPGDKPARQAIEDGIQYLITTQREDGSWDEPWFTGTGFPRAFMINYHLYRNYFPLTALGRYCVWRTSGCWSVPVANQESAEGMQGTIRSAGISPGPAGQGARRLEPKGGLALWQQRQHG
jgi:squalene-hopene/tetraprenyl-beta-curcumene cyclase